jgi:hypothetical protein
VRYTELTIGTRRGRKFEVRCRAEMDLIGFSEDDEENKDIRVVADIALPYSHLYLSSLVLKPLEQNLDQAAEIAARHVDLTLYKPPIVDRGGFFFEPLI